MRERRQYRGLRDVTLSYDRVAYRPARGLPVSHWNRISCGGKWSVVATTAPVSALTKDSPRPGEFPCNLFPAARLPIFSRGIMIRFDLSITLDYTVQAPSDFVFVIQPTSTPYQRVTWEKLTTEPQVNCEEELHGSPANRHLRMRAEGGPLRVRY